MKTLLQLMAEAAEWPGMEQVPEDPNRPPRQMPKYVPPEEMAQKRKDDPLYDMKHWWERGAEIPGLDLPYGSLCVVTGPVEDWDEPGATIPRGAKVWIDNFQPGVWTGMLVAPVDPDEFQQNGRVNSDAVVYFGIYLETGGVVAGPAASFKPTGQKFTWPQVRDWSQRYTGGDAGVDDLR